MCISLLTRLAISEHLNVLYFTYAMCKVHIILNLVITTNPKAKENLYPRAYQAAVTVTVCVASRPFNVLAGAFQNAFFVGGLYNVIVTLGSFFTFG